MSLTLRLLPAPWLRAGLQAATALLITPQPIIAIWRYGLQLPALRQRVLE